MNVCILQPDYSASSVDYKHYDPPRNLSSLLPEARVDHVFLNKLTTYRQLKELRHKNYDVFVNLCEGYLEWDTPSIDVIHSLEMLDLPFTGPNSILYDPPKTVMKYAAFCAGVKTPAGAVVTNRSCLDNDCRHLSFPLFVKPAKAGDSLGIDENSLVENGQDLTGQVEKLLPLYDELLIEEYIPGREFTVLLAANPDGNSCTVFRPVEYVFPDGCSYKTYASKTSALHPSGYIASTDNDLNKRIRAAAAGIFRNFNGVGYARLDFRLNDKGELYFLEINFTCSVFYTDGYEGSADYILQLDGFGPQRFLRHIIEEGIARHKRRQKKYAVRGNSTNGYGLFAVRDIGQGEIVFKGEGKAQRIITKSYVAAHWNAEEKKHFGRYAYHVSDEVFILWDDDPAQWAPQNHSCEPNTAYHGLDVMAVRPIQVGEELTLDYSTFLNEHMEPFACKCGTPHCRGIITGTAGNSVSKRSFPAP